MSSLTAKLARHIVGYRTAELDSAALTVAKQCVLDWYGVTLAGANEPVARILREELAGSAQGPASIVGFNLRCSPVDAALINGATSHALDYDDVHPLIGHPTATVLPALLAIAETTGRSGMDVLRAFIAGHEAAAFVGSLVMRSHYERGFHATATLGSFGAAAAAGLLLELDETQMAIALGLAGTQAAGLKSMFGTMAKPFHAGRAAANGVLAARLAARGFTANPGVLEAPQGFIVTQSDADPSVDAPLPRPGSLVVDTLFKYHAACYLTHSSIEAIKLLRRQLAFNGPDVASIDLHVAPGHLSVCNIASPRSGLETKFSLRHTAALAACGKDTAAIQTYSDKNARDATLTTIRERVIVHGDRNAGRDANVVIKTSGGETAEANFDVAIPDRDLERQGGRLAAKFHSLADAVIGAERAGMLQHKIAGLDKHDDIHVLMAA